MQKRSNRINGLILAGGSSSRMGKDKGLIDYHGMPQREFLHALLGKFCHTVYLSCKSAENIPASLNPLPDGFSIASPLNGILTAFQKDATVSWLTVPVDMPFITQAVLEYLVAMSDPARMATCFADSGGKDPEPLLALWEPSTALPLQEFYRSGNLSPKKFLKENNIKRLVPPTQNLHANMNTPSDLDNFLSKGNP
ncbi:MAG TPA: molybdenum cofactor guanylyltransferase [Ohtaekwangia sp.]|nr:molybdenum cofactor guanylyltransferase [Ohtaekwangia sp.]